MSRPFPNASVLGPLFLLAALAGCATPPAGTGASARADAVAMPATEDYAAARSLCLPSPIVLRSGLNPGLARACGIVIDAQREPPVQLSIAHLQRAQAASQGPMPEWCPTALPDIEKAVLLAPANPMARLYRGVCYRVAGRHLDALQDFDAVLSDKSDFIRHAGLHGRADTLMRMGRDAEAITAYTEALRLSPNDAESYRDRALSRWKLEQVDLALADVDRAIQLNPGDAFAYALRGGIQNARGATAQAQQDIQRARQLDPNLPRTFQRAQEELNRQRQADR